MKRRMVVAQTAIWALIGFSSCLPKNKVTQGSLSGVQVSDRKMEDHRPTYKILSTNKDKDFVCPSNMLVGRFDKQVGAFCVMQKNGKKYMAGPFTDEMRRRCRQYGGESGSKGDAPNKNTCDADYYLLDFAVGLRGSGRCPAGSMIKDKYAACMGKEKTTKGDVRPMAYGPFKRTHWEQCLRQEAKYKNVSGFNINCNNLKWPQNHFEKEYQDALFTAPLGFFGAVEPGVLSARFTVMSQSNGVSCGQQSVAMVINYFAGKVVIRDSDFSDDFALLARLQSQASLNGKLRWRDIDFPTVGARAWWSEVEEALNWNLPVVAAANGPNFSPSGIGHIFVIKSVNGDMFTFADPNGGIDRTISKSTFNNAENHPEGKWAWVPEVID